MCRDMDDAGDGLVVVDEMFATSRLGNINVWLYVRFRHCAPVCGLIGEDCAFGPLDRKFVVMPYG